MRYSYLRGPGGRFRNPYDHGVRKNCSDFFLKEYNEDIERVVQTLQPDEEMDPIQTRSAVLQNGESVPLLGLKTKTKFFDYREPFSRFYRDYGVNENENGYRKYRNKNGIFIRN